MYPGVQVRSDEQRYDIQKTLAMHDLEAAHNGGVREAQARYRYRPRFVFSGSPVYG